MVSTRRCSVISFTVRVFGTETSMPDCNTGAVIMKMTSRTSTTSTSGVMLISASELRVWPVLLVKATFCLSVNLRFGFPRRSGRPDRNLLERIQQFPAKVIDGRRKYPYACSELVVCHHSRHCYKKPGGGGNQRLGDARRDGPQRCRARSAQA